MSLTEIFQPNIMNVGSLLKRGALYYQFRILHSLIRWNI